MRFIFAFIVMALFSCPNLSALDKNDFEWIKPDQLNDESYVRYIAFDPEGTPYIQTNGTHGYTIQRQTSAGWEIINTPDRGFDPGADLEYWDMECDPAGNLWLCGDEYLWKFDGERWDKFFVDDTMDERQYSHIAIDHKGVVYVEADAIVIISIDSTGPGQPTKHARGYHEIWKIESGKMENILFGVQRDIPLIDDLGVDDMGQVWFVARKFSRNNNKRLFRYDGNNWERFEVFNSEGIQAEMEARMFIDNGKIYFAFSIKDINEFRGGISEFREGQGWQHFDMPIPKMGAHDFVRDPQNTFWIAGGPFDLLRWRPGSDPEIIHFDEIFEIEDNTAWRVRSVHAIEMAPDGRLWFGTGQGIMVLRQPVGVEENKVASGSLSVWPNPARDRVHIRSDLGLRSRCSIELYNSISGAAPAGSYSVDRNGDEFTLDVSALSSGVYIAIIRSGSEARRAKFVITR